MADYMTTESSEIEIGNDHEELLLKVQKLSTENEDLNKKLREKEHEFSQSTTELQMQNDTLKRSNDNLESLVKTYKSMSNTSHNGDLEELSQIVNELEKKLLITEQSELNLKRQNQSLNMQVRDLKFEMEKLSLNKGKDSSKSSMQEVSDLDNLDEETKNLLTMLMTENDDLKREKNEVSDKALNMLTQKEVEIIELQEKIDDLKKTHQEEMNKIISKMGELKSDLVDKNEDDERQSLNSEEAKMLLENYKELSDEYEDFKREALEREKLLIYEHEKIQRELDVSEKSYKTNIQELEGEIQKLKTEMYNNEIERLQAEKDQQEDESKTMLFVEIENLQQQVRALEDQKDKQEFKYKEQLSRLDEEIKELDKTNSQLKLQKSDIERELNTLKTNSNKNMKETQEKARVEVQVKEKEIQQLQERISNLCRENDSFKKEMELQKKNLEKHRNEYKELVENSKKIKENNTNELNKWEEKYSKLRDKSDKDKEHFEEYIRELEVKIRTFETRASIHVKQSLQFKEKEDETPHDIGMTNQVDSEALNAAQGKINLLNEEIRVLNEKIIDLSIRSKSLEKMKNDCDLLNMENSKLKKDMAEMKDMYEKQIEEINNKTLQIASELHSTRRRATSRLSTNMTSSAGLNSKQMQIYAELENTVTKLTGEAKYLNEKIEILNKEIDNLKKLREKDVKFLKEELRTTEEQAIVAKVNLATMAFEKDSELIKYRNICKKLKLRLQNYQVNNQLVKQPTTKKK
jgi:hypothetical protein